MPTSTRIPNFKSEKEEAEWWDAHPESLRAFPEGEEGREDKRLPVVRGVTRSTTIRLPITDIETAQQIAEKRGLPYQTYLKGLLHQALDANGKRDRSRGLALHKARRSRRRPAVLAPGLPPREFWAYRAPGIRDGRSPCLERSSRTRPRWADRAPLAVEESDRLVAALDGS